MGRGHSFKHDFDIFFEVAEDLIGFDIVQSVQF